MDFGKLEFSKLNGVNFKLPKEPYTNSNILKGRPASQAKIQVGLSRWGRKEWIGKLYPGRTKENSFQQEYQRCFNVIEFNSTHYKLPSDQDIDNWLSKANLSDLLFCPKLYQGISHFGSLNDKQFLTDVFLTSMRKFGKHLGPILLQVSDKFGPKRKDELFEYLGSLPKDVQFFLEVRHPDWFEPAALDELIHALQILKIGFVITDTAGRRDVAHMHLAIPKVMIRFVGNDLHETDFKRLDDWILRIRYWIESGLQELYFFVHSLDEKFAPELTKSLINGLNEHCNAGLKEIKFHS